MTCREFKHAAVSLTLWELTRAQDEQVLRHTNACEPCSAWLQKQRTLAASMQTLQARTAGLEAGPDVERTLLRAFRQQHSEPAEPVAAHRFTPIAMRLSRFFEIGAYVAIAAALVVGVFLGIRLLQQRSTTDAVQGQSAPVRTAPLTQKADAAAQNAAAKVSAPDESHPHATVSRNRVQRASLTASASGSTAARSAAVEQAQTSLDAGYIPLMFCDPLSCSSDSQVVRMELPTPGNSPSQDTAPQVADVVVGYDGVVRAVRIVN